MNLFADLGILVGGIVISGVSSWATGYYNGYRKHQAKVREQRERQERIDREMELPLEWEVRVVADPTYGYLDESTNKHTKDMHTCLVVNLVKEGNDPVRMAWFDIRKDETERRVKEAVEEAQAKADYMNTMGVRGVA